MFSGEWFDKDLQDQNDWESNVICEDIPIDGIASVKINYFKDTINTGGAVRLTGPDLKMMAKLSFYDEYQNEMWTSQICKYHETGPVTEHVF